ncbi:unnamed protein product [Gadus morhua 'NCC']
MQHEFCNKHLFFFCCVNNSSHVKFPHHRGWLCRRRGDDSEWERANDSTKHAHEHGQTGSSLGCTRWGHPCCTVSAPSRADCTSSKDCSSTTVDCQGASTADDHPAALWLYHSSGDGLGADGAGTTCDGPSASASTSPGSEQPLPATLHAYNRALLQSPRPSVFLPDHPATMSPGPSQGGAISFSFQPRPTDLHLYLFLLLLLLFFLLGLCTPPWPRGPRRGSDGSPAGPRIGGPQARAAAPASRPAQPPQTAVAVAPGGPAVAQEMQDNVKKCKNFLATLIKLASHNSPSPETSKNVKSLVQDLLDAKIEPEEFTSRLQAELKSSPQPYLVPFLKKSLPALRLSLLSSQHSVPTPQQGVKPGVYPGPPVAGGAAVRVHYPNSVGPATGAGGLAAAHTAGVGMKRGGVSGGQVRTPVATPCMRAQGALCKGLVGAQTGRGPAGMGPPGSGNQKNKPNDPGGGSFRDDDDINDVASMAGVNLNEESARILATNSELVGTHIRSCKDEAFLHPGLLHRRILEAAKRFGVTEVPMDSVTFISHAAQARLRTVLETVSSIAQHRLDSCKDEEWYEPSADVRSQLRFFEQLERMEKQRKDEQEREILLKAAKSRARLEDPEQARLKQKAKEMQQHELAQTRQREANLTALAAIGPRKKRKMDSAWATASGSEQGTKGALQASAGQISPKEPLAGSGGSVDGCRRFLPWPQWKHTRCDRKPCRLALGVFASCVDTKGGARGLFHGEPRAPRPPERLRLRFRKSGSASFLL